MLRLVHREGARAKKQRAIRQQRLQSYAVCHVTAYPERGPVVLIYGCSECNWIYRPQTQQEVPKCLGLRKSTSISTIAQNLICGSPDFHEKRYHCRLKATAMA